jgi:conjugative relaxase-like TrwC/TraI family protein
LLKGSGTMMSISKPMNAKQAGKYFTKEDYYLGGAGEGNSRWCGRGAGELGLEGPVGEGEFRALCRGEDPAGKRIVKYQGRKKKGVLIEKHLAGNDCTLYPSTVAHLEWGFTLR